MEKRTFRPRKIIAGAMLAGASTVGLGMAVHDELTVSSQSNAISISVLGDRLFDHPIPEKIQKKLDVLEERENKDLMIAGGMFLGVLAGGGIIWNGVKKESCPEKSL